MDDDMVEISPISQESRRSSTRGDLLSDNDMSLEREESPGQEKSDIDDQGNASGDSNGNVELPTPSSHAFPYLRKFQKEEALVKANACLSALDLAPITYEDSRRIGKLRDKVTELTDAFVEHVREGTGKLLTPKVDLPCEYCNDLVEALKQRYREVKSGRERYQILTSTPRCFGIRLLMQKFHVSQYVAAKAVHLRTDEGSFTCPIFAPRRFLDPATVSLVKEFYLNPDHGKISPVTRESVWVTINGTKQKAAKHRMLMNLKDLYSLFVDEHGEARVSISKFSRLRPKNCVWPGIKGFHEVCCCLHHENFQHMLEAADKDADMACFLKSVVCDQPTSSCYLSLCDRCPKDDKISELFHKLGEEDDDFTMEFYQWLHTDRTDLELVSMQFSEYRQKFIGALFNILEHDFVTREQQRFFSDLKKNKLPNTNEIFVQVDFSQNYSFVLQNEIYGYHWSKDQCTIHPFAITKWNGAKVTTDHIVVISDELGHDAVSFHAFRKKVINKILADAGEAPPTKIVYCSDGAGSQYKNVKNMANLILHEHDFGVKAEWHFTATAHGKSTCDAVGAVTKRATRLESLRPNTVINSAQQVFNFCEKKLTSDILQFIFVAKEDVDTDREEAEERYRPFKKIPGIRENHAFIPRDDRSLYMKKVSSQDEAHLISFRTVMDNYYNFDELEVGQFYSYYDGEMFQIGMLVETHNDSEEVELQCLRVARNGNMRWPAEPVTRLVPLSHLLLKNSDPVHSADRKVLRLVPNDWEETKARTADFKRKMTILRPNIED